MISPTGSTSGFLQSLLQNPQMIQSLIPGVNLAAMASAFQAQQNLDQAPLTNIAHQESTLSSQSQAWSQVASALQAVQQDVQALSTTQDLNPSGEPVSSNNQVATASGTDAPPGEYVVTVTQLAQNEIENSTQVSGSGTTALDQSGTLTLTYGTSSPVTVTVSSDESLQQIGQALVSAASSVGLDLSAVLLPSTSGTELSLSGATGSNSFSVSGTLSGGLGFNLVQSGAAASYSVNQVDNTSPTNTIENGLAPGVTLNLLSTGSTTMTVSPDYSQVTSQVSKLVNDVMSVINTINKVAGKGGPLEGNAALLNLAQNLVSDLSQTNSALPAGYQSLLNLGLSVSWSQSTGETVSFDSSAFQQALQQNPQAVTGLFTGAGGSPGIANTVSNFLNGFLAPTTGIVASAQSGITSQEKTLSQEQASLQQLIQQEQTEADNQFIAELQTMLKEALLQQSLSAQFATANGSRSGSGPSANAVP